MSTTSSRPGRGTIALVVLALTLSAARLAAAPPAAAAQQVLRGRVVSGGSALAAHTVTVFRAGRSAGEAAVALGTGPTDVAGAFEISYEAPPTTDVTYVMARPAVPAANPAVLVSVLGTGPVPGEVVVNERTTVAGAYGMAQFVGSGGIAGTRPGLPNATGMVRNLVNVRTGEPGEVLLTAPNVGTSTIDTFNSLANMVAACVAAPLACTALLDAAAPTGGTSAVDSFHAMATIARNPANRVVDLFAVSVLPPQPYSPARDVPPPAWTLALRFHANGSTLSGPGNFAIDHEGNLWVTANYQYNADPLVPVCGADLVFKFLPDGRSAPGSPYRGGGLSGAGFGIDIDRYGDVWIGNYGFAAPEPGCPADRQPSHDSVSKFSPAGSPLSPASGFTQGGVNWPQGTVEDDDGNIWMANCESSTMTRYAGGDPNSAREIGGLGVTQPFDIIDNGQHVFVTGIVTDNVAMLGRDGTPTAVSPITGGGLSHPLGIATDSGGNVWVANSGAVDLPCPERPTAPGGVASISLIGPDGRVRGVSGFTGGGLTVPWGIAVDGADNVWVANFAGKRLSHFCGADPSKCPAGTSTGDAISPDLTGYGFDGLVRNTGVDIDQSGNVWVANNWLEVPVQTNPGGHEIVAFVGLASPVQRDAPVPKPAGPGQATPAVPVGAAPSLTG